MKLLFLGDSTTDMFRQRDYGLPYSLGEGHVFMIAETLLEKSQSYEIINRGCSGDRITNINDRFQTDCLDINADVVTMMFGVNDIWYPLANMIKPIKLSDWENIYQSFINRIKAINPKAIIILMSPFILHGEVTDSDYEGFSKVFKLAKIVKRLARNNNLIYIDTQKPLSKLAEKIGDSAVLYDGVHPNVMGAKCLANIWLKKAKSANIIK